MFDTQAPNFTLGVKNRNDLVPRPRVILSAAKNLLFFFNGRLLSLDALVNSVPTGGSHRAREVDGSLLDQQDSCLPLSSGS
jgi:hypothetical protein